MKKKNVAWNEAQAQQAQLKKQAVLAEAAALFNQRGYHATSLVDVAERLGLTKTALYYYVKNKNDLLCATYHAALEEIDNDVGSGREQRFPRGLDRPLRDDHLPQVLDRPACQAIKGERIEDQAVEPLANHG